MSEEIEIEGEVIASTPDAILFQSELEQAWVPKSQIKDYCGESVEKAESIFIPEYMALQKGFI